MRSEKESMLREIKERIAASEFVAVVNYKGMNTAQANELRRRLKATGFEFHVAPNSLIRKAIADLGWEAGDASALFTGPSGVVTGKGEPPQSAKTITDFISEIKITSLKGGYLERRYLAGAQISELASLPPKEILQAIFLGALLAPLRRLLGLMRQTPGGLVYVLNALHAKQSDSKQQ